MKSVLSHHKKVIAAVFLCLASGLFAAGKKPNPIREPQMNPLVPHALIREAGWTYNWQIHLPVRTNEAIDRIYVLGDYLYVMTDSNVLFCVQRREGRMVHSIRLAPKGVPVCAPTVHEQSIAFISGNQMRLFDPRSGLFVQTEEFQHVGNTFECGVAQNDNYIYVTGSDNRLHAISKDGYWEAFTATADNDSPIHSVIATDQIVTFATQAGNVVGMQTYAPKKIWQYDISGTMRARIVTDRNYVYVAGMDAKLYKINLQMGTPAWEMPYHAGAPILDPPVIGSQVIYLYTDLNGLYGLRKSDGQFVWNIARGKDVLCETPGRGFLYTAPGILTVMDNESGEELYSVNINQVQRYAVNTTDAVLYMADKAGRLMSISVD